ncbi:hypothetical protein [Sphingobium scionense]|nr:hypothetical protein [Sphingobium scionense]MBB4148671.1 hypothetical protein [Sphingobium scionense]
MSAMAAASLCLIAVPPSAVQARGPAMLVPVQLGAETARYHQGVPTLHLETPTGAVEVRPLPVRDGQLSFAVAVYNKGDAPANFGPENVWSSIGPVLTKEQLKDGVRRRARGAKIATVIIAGTLAGVASTASSHGTYYGWARTPRGPVPTAIRWEDHSVGVLGAAAAVGGGALAIHAIDRRLGHTLDQFESEILQTNTVDPGASFGGMAIIPIERRQPLAPDIRLTVRWNGADYPFAFRPTGADAPAPQPFESATPRDYQIEPQSDPR